MLVGAMKAVSQKNGTKIVLDRDFLNIWWLLKEPFDCGSKLI